ncbi:hypothetical protein OIU84_011686 [Salix udensis]|uniref:Uncharacterized protein n=1 Tax=Salix udensis TaxID=889485 RepID=A0AAD6JNG9_9ROSI|nr:hypothetical protein OIU84_011686 [Salix udensis]
MQLGLSRIQDSQVQDNKRSKPLQQNFDHQAFLVQVQVLLTMILAITKPAMEVSFRRACCEEEEEGEEECRTSGEEESGNHQDRKGLLGHKS